MFTYVLYGMAICLLAFSLVRSREKTKMALKKSWMMFNNLLPQLTALFVFVGLLLALVNQNVISALIGKESGVLGVIVASLIGAITLLPGFVAFPLASNLLHNGAGVAQIAALVSAMMMVGVATFALEAKTLGRKAALLRNGMALIYAFVIAAVMGGVYS